MSELTFSELSGYTDKQWQATDTADNAIYTLFGGSRGPGKSHWLRYYHLRRLLRWAAQGHSGVRVMLACEDYPSLYERQISKVLLQFPGWLGSYHQGRNEFKLHPAYGSGVIAFRNLDDASKYQSAEFAGIAVDEITKNPERTFHLLRGSLRWPGIEDCYFVAASNPEANWVRDYWIERKLPDELQAQTEKFAFVAALPEDNPHLPPSYWAMLDTLPGALRQAWRYGNWYAAVEGLVYENFGPDNLTDTEPDAGLPFEIAVDDGYIDPRATLLIQRQPNGDILVFDELYQTKTLEEQSIGDLYDRCLVHFGGGAYGEQLAAAGVEWDALTLDEKTVWANRLGLKTPELAAVSHEAVALQQRLRRANIPARNWLADKAGGGQSTRLAAITLTRSLICDGQGYRALKIHRRCKNLLDEIGAGYKYPEGKHGLQTKPADGNDHACNALESWIWLRARRG